MSACSALSRSQAARAACVLAVVIACDLILSIGPGRVGVRSECVCGVEREGGGDYKEFGRNDLNLNQVVSLEVGQLQSFFSCLALSWLKNARDQPRAIIVFPIASAALPPAGQQHKRVLCESPAICSRVCVCRLLCPHTQATEAVAQTTH